MAVQRSLGTRAVWGVWLFCVVAALGASAAERMDRYYAHETREDAHGVIAPWYDGQNGVFDWRVRIAGETLKRYPWTAPGEAVAVAPHHFYNGTWQIAPDGTISIPELNNWNTGDQSQRIAYLLSGLVDYYRYTGDATAIAMMKATADPYLDHCLTSADHPWPRFPITVPVKGVPYGDCSPEGYIQTDIAAEVGYALLRAYQVAGEERWFEAAKHWGGLFAYNVGTGPDGTPWSRYANPEVVPWSDRMNGGVSFILFFLDELIRLGYTGPEDIIVEARDAGRAYLRDELLPDWTRVDAWGRNFWDWECTTQCTNVTTFTCWYLMAHPDAFPNWRNDVWNIMTLFLNRTSVSLQSGADAYSGAWAYPESAGCCGRSLWYPPMEASGVFAEYGVRTDSAWGREMGRRQQILATYGELDHGLVEDNIDGGQIVAGSWFKITHPMALKHILYTMAWLPEVQGANRENHIMRSTAVVRDVVYDPGAVQFETFDAPADTETVLRLAFAPERVTADGGALEQRADLEANGYTVKALANGDCIVHVRHDGATRIEVVGDGDPQQACDEDALTFGGTWRIAQDAAAHGGALAATAEAGAEMTFRFTGNQVRLVGRFAPDGGMADVYLDGEKQLVPVDCWNPTVRDRQTLYYRNGLENAEHVLRIVARGAGNPIAPGTTVYVDAVRWSDATGEAGFGEGGGPTGTQRMVFGYPGRTPIIDSHGEAWAPGLEFVVRLGDMQDPVKGAWWTEPRAETIENTPDPELYRHGVHAPRFWVNVTVGPGAYYVRLKLAETRDVDPALRAMNVAINGEKRIEGLDIAATAGGLERAADLVFQDVHPRNGVIEVALQGMPDGEAILQALEVGPGQGGPGAEAVCLPEATLQELRDRRGLLGNGGFEHGAFTLVGGEGTRARAMYWRAEVVSDSRCYVWGESAYSAHPETGLPVFRSGAQALRTHTDGAGHTRVWQEVEVEPDTTYRASAWVYGYSNDGRGFGAHPDDSAGIVLEELGADGAVIATHPKAAITEATDGYAPVETTVTTSPETRRVRFVLDTVIDAHYEPGHVSYDDCAFAVVRPEEG